VTNNEVAIIGSDHAPHTIEEKKQPYPKSPSGIPGAQTIFPLMLNAHLENKISLEQLVNYFVKNPVEIFKIKNKGQIKEGFDGDLTIFSDQGFTIKNEDQASKCGWTPFDGKRLKGRVEMTVVGGKVVMIDNRIIAKENSSSAVDFHH
jgi:dihydroorotase